MYVEIREENDDSFVWAQPNDFSRHLSDQALCLIILAYGNERNFSYIALSLLRAIRGEMASESIFYSNGYFQHVSPII